uniref:Candidate secreted effector n=1 Tax=Meloidogyne incognita TaxID=6306 RepID=A0A914L9G1_MELIC
MSYLSALSRGVNNVFLPWSYAALGISLYFFINAAIYAATTLLLINKENILNKERWLLGLEEEIISEIDVSSVISIEGPIQEEGILVDYQFQIDSTPPSNTPDSSSSQEEES